MYHLILIVLFCCCSVISCDSSVKIKNSERSIDLEYVQKYLLNKNKSLPSGWTIHAYPNKDTIVCGERLEVTVTLVNETNDTISLHWQNPLNPLVDMCVIDLDQPQYLLIITGCGVSYPRIIHIAPFASYSETHGWTAPGKDNNQSNKVYAIVPYLRGDRYYTGIGDPVAVTVIEK